MNSTISSNAEHIEFANNKVYVKYMVSLRCKMIVKSELKELGLNYTFSSHGAIEFHDQVSEENYELLEKNLRKSGIVLLNESESLLINKIINTIIEVVHHSDELPDLSFSDLINKHVVVGNDSILQVFSDVTGMSVLQFIVYQKIERAKELLLYDDMPLSEIADLLKYKNKQYLVAQFKKVTGLNPSYFKKLREERNTVAEEATFAKECHECSCS